MRVEALKCNYEKVLKEIKVACENVGRSPDEITIVAVTKNVDVNTMMLAHSVGMKHFGENRAQELRDKYPELEDLDVTWHFIGRIQTNKVKYFVPICEYVHSLWRIEEAKEIQKRADKLGKNIKIFVEVNITGESTKAGLNEVELKGFLKELRVYDRLEIIGLMTMAPYVENPEEVRWVFRRLKEKLNELKNLNGGNIKLEHLSMGMSNDYRIAVEEGATFVRIGTAIFRGGEK